MTKPKSKPFMKPRQIKAEPKKPEIPKEILRDFLEEKVNLSSLKDISLIRAGFLWKTGDIERYRVNVWRTTYEGGTFCPNTKIVESFFVYYYRDEQMILDKTTKPNLNARKIF
jgi:hypothetical protein